MNLDAYRSTIDNALAAARKWQAEREDKTLPDSVWDMPSDCPLWEMGLSLAQAGGVLGILKAEARKTTGSGGDDVVNDTGYDTR